MNLELTESTTTESYQIGRWIQTYKPAGFGEPFIPDGAPWFWLGALQWTTHEQAKWEADERNKDVSLTSPFEAYHVRTATTISKVVSD